MDPLRLPDKDEYTSGEMSFISELDMRDQNFNLSGVRYIHIVANTIGKSMTPLILHPQVWVN